MHPLLKGHTCMCVICKKLQAQEAGIATAGNVYFKKAFDPKAKFRVKRPTERAFRRFSSDSLGILSQGSPLQSWKMSVQVPGHLQVAPCFLAVLKSDPRLPLGYLAHCQARTSHCISRTLSGCNNAILGTIPSMDAGAIAKPNAVPVLCNEGCLQLHLGCP